MQTTHDVHPLTLTLTCVVCGLNTLTLITLHSYLDSPHFHTRASLGASVLSKLAPFRCVP